MKMIKFCSSDDVSHVWVPLIIVEKTVEISPILYLFSPLVKSGKRGKYQKRSYNLFVGMQMVKKGYGLNCFAETHLVG